MKPFLLFLTFLAGAFTILCVFSFTNKNQTGPYVLQHEKDIAVQQPGPHDGGGSTVAYLFFENVKDFNMAFCKRVLNPGSTIGFHLQETDEVYYILSGRGEMKMNGETFAV